MLEIPPTSGNLDQRLAALSPAQRAMLERRLMQKTKRPRPDPRAIMRQPDRSSAPLSYNQQGLWVLNQLMPGQPVYHSPAAVRFTGPLHVQALIRGLQTIVDRHESLRTTFQMIDGSPRQVINNFSLDVPQLDLSDWQDSEREAQASRILRDEVRRPFDLACGPLVRAILLRMTDDDHILLVTMHHIVTDGWSFGIFNRELSRLYAAFAAERPSSLPELVVQYLDYSVWQRERLAGGVYEAQLAYWKKQFRVLPPPLELPSDYPRRNEIRSYRGAQQTISLSADLTREIKRACQNEGVTLFMMLMAAYQILLHRYTGQDDIVIGTPIAGRQQQETERLIGLFINTLAIRLDLSGAPTVREILERVKRVALGAYAHQDLPFERLVKELQPDRSLAHNPLFQVMFVLQGEEVLQLQLPGIKVEHFRIDHDTANFDLTLDVVEKNGQLECKFEANADLFAPETIQRMMRHFANLVQDMVGHPAKAISQLNLLTGAEERQLLVDWNRTSTAYPAKQTISQLFEQQAREDPDATALIWRGEKLSYGEVNRRANRLAHYLRRRGVTADTRVGVCLQRSPQMIATIIAILKAGGAYVPLDPDYPQARFEFMLQDAQARLLLTEKSLAPAIFANGAELICVDQIVKELASESETDLEPNTTSNNLAYVMYTSGSTGQPKGVAVTHRNVVRLVKHTTYASFSPGEVFLQSSTISFDASTFEIWGSLLNGARLVLLDIGKPSLEELAEAIKANGVTTLWLTAGLFHLMVDNHLHDLRGLRQLLAGGDVLSVPHVEKVSRELPNCRLINGYGPTENTTFTCCYTVGDSSVNGSVPIGRPISNTFVYVLDRFMNPAPIGVPGELYIGGDGLARGYLNRPDLTAERFVPNPFADDGTRLYRTGDLARYRSNGEIEFLGRLDNQVKVRGFRIDLGEIEAALLAHPAVREAVVTTRTDSGDKHLAAYLVPRNGHLPTKEVRQFLNTRLPAYMVPSVFSWLEALPLSPVGKVDRRALPPPHESQAEFKPTNTAPTDELELKLTQIWQKVLHVRTIGVDENFFELGGHSLLAVKLFVEIQKAFGWNLPLATLFQAPTVRQLGRVLRDEGWQAAWSSLVPIQTAGARRPFFCMHAAGGNVLEYEHLARLLGDDQPFYGLQAQGLDGQRAPHTTIKEMAAHYIKEMREVQPEGPYLLGGRSSGGTIAFEMACQLHGAGEQVALLALFDTFPAGYFKLLPGSAGFGQRFTRQLKKWRMHVANLGQLNAVEKAVYTVNKLQFAPAKIKHKIYRRVYKFYRKFGKPLPQVLQNIEEINFTAVKDYQPQIYSGDVTLFLATDLTADYDSADGWRELVRGKIETHQVPGNHLDMIKEPGVRVLAEKLKEALVQAAQD